jgi:hypothetical protein
MTTCVAYNFYELTKVGMRKYQVIRRNGEKELKGDKERGMGC